jgi:hypothetical protein
MPCSTYVTWTSPREGRVARLEEEGGPNAHGAQPPCHQYDGPEASVGGSESYQGHGGQKQRPAYSKEQGYH